MSTADTAFNENASSNLKDVKFSILELAPIRDDGTAKDDSDDDDDDGSDVDEDDRNDDDHRGKLILYPAS